MKFYNKDKVTFVEVVENKLYIKLSCQTELVETFKNEDEAERYATIYFSEFRPLTE